MAYLFASIYSVPKLKFWIFQTEKKCFKPTNNGGSAESPINVLRAC